MTGRRALRALLPAVALGLLFLTAFAPLAGASPGPSSSESFRERAVQAEVAAPAQPPASLGSHPPTSSPPRSTDGLPTRSSTTTSAIASRAGRTSSWPSTLEVNISATPATVDVHPSSPTPGDYNTTLRAYTQGGSSTGWAWSGLPPGCIDADLSYILCSPTQVGNYTVDVLVEDSVGGTATAPTFILTVNPDPKAVIEATPVAGPLPVNATLQGSTLGGQAPFLYNWSFGDGENTSTANPARHDYNVLGSYTVTLTVRDAVGGISVATRSISVISPLTISLRVLPDNDTFEHRNLNFNGTVVGGTGEWPFLFVWTGLPPGCQVGNVQAFSCLPNATGTFHVTLTVSDSAGEERSLSLALTVNALPAQTPPPLSPFTITEALVALLVAVGAVVGLWLVPARRSKEEEGAAAPPPSPPPQVPYLPPSQGPPPLPPPDVSAPAQPLPEAQPPAPDTGAPLPDQGPPEPDSGPPASFEELGGGTPTPEAPPPPPEGEDTGTPVGEPSSPSESEPPAPPEQRPS